MPALHTQHDSIGRAGMPASSEGPRDPMVLSPEILTLLGQTLPKITLGVGSLLLTIRGFDL